WLHVHHIVHWEDEGPTDTPNLVALCSKHHRLHHRGHLGISGDADDPHGLTFTDARGRPLAPRATPRSPSEPLPTGNWVHPTGERLDDDCVVFSDPPVPATATATAAEVAAATLASPIRDYPPFVDLDDPVFGVHADEDEVVGFG
ncbi:MAG: HNH endonuclease, partial [Actinobacteria bacterium]|nr:HNH endonuclease [Actinomycetota bacterium]